MVVRSILVFLLVIQLVAITFAEEKTPPAKESSSVNFPSVGLQIEQPKGFTKSTTFKGFQQDETGASVVLLHIPGPWKKVSSGFNEAGLVTKGIKLHSKESVEVDKKNGFLLHVSQKAYGRTFNKWIVAFGDENHCKLITATFLDDSPKELRDKLKEVVLNATTSEIVLPEKPKLPFSVTPPKELVSIKQMGSTGVVAAFNKTGTIPQTDPSDPFLFVVPSLGDIPVPDKKSFAQRRIKAMPGVKDIQLQSTEDVTIDGLSGFEIEAEAMDKKSDTPTKLYQVILFPERGGYYLITGTVGLEHWEKYSPEFKEMAKSFREVRK